MGTNFILVSKKDNDCIVTIHANNKYLWDQIEDKRLMHVTANNCDDLDTYAVAEDALSKLSEPWISDMVEPVFIVALMRENRNINLDIRSAGSIKAEA